MYQSRGQECQVAREREWSKDFSKPWVVGLGITTTLLRSESLLLFFSHVTHRQPSKIGVINLRFFSVCFFSVCFFSFLTSQKQKNKTGQEGELRGIESMWTMFVYQAQRFVASGVLPRQNEKRRTIERSPVVRMYQCEAGARAGNNSYNGNRTGLL